MTEATPRDEALKAPVLLSLGTILLWACLVTASFFCIRPLLSGVLPVDLPLTTAIGCAGALGVGTQLLGPLLYGFRLRQPRAYRISPGERLWICDAAAFVFRLAPFVLLWTMDFLFANDNSLRTFAARNMPIFEVLSAIGCALLYWTARAHISSTWWRWAFGACAGTHLGLAAAVGIPLFVVGTGKMLWLIAISLFGLQLMVTAAAVISNVRQPWSHWIGAMLPFWNAFVLLAFMGLYAFLHQVF